MDWLQNHIWPAEQALINEKSVTAGTRLAALEMIRGGVTCFSDHYFFHNTIADVAAEMGIRVCAGMLVINVPTQWAKDENEYLAKARATMEKGHSSNLVTYAIAPHAPYTVTDPSLIKVKELSDHYNIPIHMHVQETSFEVEQHIKQFGVTPIQRLHNLKLLSPHFIAVHMVSLSDEDIGLVQKTGSHVVHCPESNLKLASGFAPIGKLLKAKINIALGTDGTASNNDLDMLGELRTAALVAKASSLDATCLPAAQALEMATLNGAKALGLGKELGSLEPGKFADIIAIRLDDFYTQPLYNPMSQLVYAANRLQVSDVWIAGQQLLKNGEFTQLNPAQILEEVKPWAKAAFDYQLKQQPISVA